MPIHDLIDVLLREHVGQHLWITTFDSGTITPEPEELTFGWATVETAMVSPPIHLGLEIPQDQYDEWYIFEDASPRLGSFERFINFGGFSLTNDPAWKPELQEQFWAQLERLSPLTYVGSGDNDIIVTRNLSFANALQTAIQNAN